MGHEWKAHEAVSLGSRIIVKYLQFFQGIHVCKRVGFYDSETVSAEVPKKRNENRFLGSEELLVQSSLFCLSYKKPSSLYCVMLYFWWGCRGNLKSFTLGSEGRKVTEYCDQYKANKYLQFF